MSATEFETLSPKQKGGRKQKQKNKSPTHLPPAAFTFRTIVDR